MLEVRSPGLHATIQDAGRPGLGHLGIPPAGACDPLALAAANLLLGNEPGAPVLEMTLLGAELHVHAPCLVALTGAEMDAVVPEDGRRLRPGTTHRLRAGSSLVLGAARTGARAYLALAGGIEAARVLGSASTAPTGRIGARPLGPGDLLRPVEPARLDPAGRAWPGPGPASGVAPHAGPRTIRLLDGPHATELPRAAIRLRYPAAWTVTPRSDRAGLRLAGPVLPPADGPEPVSFGMTWGALELPSGGAPILLLADHPTVGGYRVPAVAISADRPALGQLQAGDEVRFARVDAATAARLATEAADALAVAAARLAAPDRP
ncbi:MAG: biotin-dependent carboxyltransferase family protein [Chloroflexota bacterium]